VFFRIAATTVEWNDFKRSVLVWRELRSKGQSNVMYRAEPADRHHRYALEESGISWNFPAVGTVADSIGWTNICYCDPLSTWLDDEDRHANAHDACATAHTESGPGEAGRGMPGTATMGWVHRRKRAGVGRGPKHSDRFCK
jgi:hypothetical protein